MDINIYVIYLNIIVYWMDINIYVIYLNIN